MPDQVKEVFLKQVVQQMSRNTLGVTLGNILAALIIGFYFWSITAQAFFVWWAIAMVLGVSLRAGVASYISHSNSPRLGTAQQHEILCLGMLLTGLGWSIFAQYSFLRLDPPQLNLMYSFIAGVVAVAVLSSSGSVKGFALFSMPILVPLAALHLVMGTTEQMLLGALALVFAAVLAGAAQSVAGFVRESATYNYENKQLLDNLVKEKEHILMLNERLQRDLKKRVGVMEWLAGGRQDHEDMSEDMDVLATLDALTGLANRRRFNEMLRLEWARARRDQTPLSLIKCDVDFFKAFNDSLGYQEGDLCLAAVASCLGRFARRSTDLVARFGEDEFVVLLPGTVEPDAVAIAEEIRDAIALRKIPHPGPAESEHISLTLGVATLTPQRELTEMSLLKQADIALYRAKQLGRNSVTSYARTDLGRKVTIQDLIRPGGG